jgi:phage terminase large subunit-like protein
MGRTVERKQTAAQVARALKVPKSLLTSAGDDPVLQYAQKVTADKIVACRYVKLACERHIKDLARQGTKEFKWKWDLDKAKRAITFFQLLPHVKGEWAAEEQNLVLALWQKFVVGSLFGWVDGTNPKKYRFREADVFVPRKNGKSVVGAGVGNYKFTADAEYGAEVYSGATTEKQAWEVFRPARQMVVKTLPMREKYSITVKAKAMVREDGSRFEPVIGKPGDGASPSCAIVDEYHEHQTDELVDTMRTGMAARVNPLLFKITTAGSDRSSPCYAAYQDCIAILSGRLVDERRFVIIYTVDEGDDWATPAACIKANPNWDVSVEAEGTLDELNKAKQSPRLQNAFKTKRLNIWVNADVAWMDMAKWDGCADAALSLDQFDGEECIDSVDLASIIDIASKVRLFRRIIDGKIHYYAFAEHYVNEERVKEAENEHYATWVNMGKLVSTPGNVTDYNFIVDGLIEDQKKFRVVEVPHDPYQSQPLLQTCLARPEWNQTVELTAIDQNVKNLSAPMKELEALVRDGRFHHTGDPVLGWMIANVVCHEDHKDNIFPNKQNPKNKIDGVLALIMALARAMARPLQSRTSIFDKGSFWETA